VKIFGGVVMHAVTNITSPLEKLGFLQLVEPLWLLPMVTCIQNRNRIQL